MMRLLLWSRFVFILFLIAIIVSFLLPVNAEDVWFIGTGDEKSASWQFVLEFSKLWQISNPDDDVALVPYYEEDLESRFENLKNRHSKMVIAPINAVSEDHLANEEINIAIILWKVYLVPMVFLKNSQTVTLNNPGIWFVTEGSTIIPAYMRQFDTSNPISPLMETIETGVIQDIGMAIPEEGQTEESFGKAVVGTTDNETGFFDILEATSDSNQTEDENQTEDSNQDRFFYSDFLAESDAAFSDNTTDIDNTLGQFDINKYISTEPVPTSLIDSIIVTENTEKIRDFFLRHPDGVFFYEMLGPVRHLKQALTFPLELIDLNPEVTGVLTENLPWVTEVRFAGSSLKTVGFQLAIFVNADEEIEFIETLIKLLRHPPGSLFPRSYIMKNLSTSKTKSLSPFILHPGTLKYFNLD